MKTIKSDVQPSASQTNLASPLVLSSKYNKPIFADTSIFIETDNPSRNLFCFAADLVLGNIFRKIVTPQNVNFERLCQHLIARGTMFNHNTSNIYFDYLGLKIFVTNDIIFRTALTSMKNRGAMMFHFKFDFYSHRTKIQIFSVATQLISWNRTFYFKFVSFWYYFQSTFFRIACVFVFDI